jgi:hypothetical protein
VFSTFWIRLNAVRALGLANVWRVLWYRVQLRCGVHPVQRLAAPMTPRGVFFSTPAAIRSLPAPQSWQEHASYFGWFRPSLLGRPAWHTNAFTGATAAITDAPWWTISDFESGVGDIKTVWEASRFDWVLAAAARAKGGDTQSLQQLNDWLDDWCVHNPPYQGPNWKCGQEASIRVMHLAVAALILDTVDAPSPALLSLVELHCARIAPTTEYAIGQDNNHGTSEAAALFIGGSWLRRHGVAGGESLMERGRLLLANRAARLIASDGSFSQHSLNYHRLMLETLSVAEVWRRHLELPSFAPIVASRGAAATRWLHAMVDRVTGDAPNLGANDGAHLLPLTDAGYRDYRPSVHLAAALFLDRVAYPSVADVTTHIAWLGVAEPAIVLDRPTSTLFDDGGYAVLHSRDAMALLRYPRFRFRPGHADALHVDLRVHHENVLRDGGSYSYNAGDEWPSYFSGARGQNTVQFDDHEQMPQVSRFLWGAWLTTESRTEILREGRAEVLAASYVDWQRARHQRRVTLSDGALDVVDDLSGFRSRAVLRWRLQPGSWELDGLTATNGKLRVTVTADVPIVRHQLVSGWESRFYFQKTVLPVLEVEVGRACRMRTSVEWTP